MATKADFSEDEWKAMQKGMTGAGMLVSVTDRDFTDSFGEASAIAKYLGRQREEGSSELIELSHTEGPGFGMTDSLQEVETETIDALRSSVATLTANAADEVPPIASSSSGRRRRLPRRRVASPRSRRRRSRSSRRRSAACNAHAATWDDPSMQAERGASEQTCA